MGSNALRAGKITKRACGNFQMKAKDMNGKFYYLYGRTVETVMDKFHDLENTLVADMVPIPANGNKSASRASCRENQFIFATYLRYWLETFKAPPNVRISTYNRLCYTAKNVIRDPISSMDIRKITPMDIQDYLNRIYATRISDSERKKRYEFVSACLNQAVRSCDIPANPCMAFRWRRQDIKRQELKAFTAAEQVRIVAALTEVKKGKPRYRMGWAFVLMLETGLRIGEAMALEWDDILQTPRGMFVSVTKGLSKDGCVPLLEPSPKTEAGIRRVPLNARAQEAIVVLRSVAVDGCPYIMGTKHGGYQLYRRMLELFQKLCENANVPRHGTHALRHTFASNCYDRGVEIKVLSKMLGHASTTITYDIYIHLFDEKYESAMLKAVGM